MDPLAFALGLVLGGGAFGGGVALGRREAVNLRQQVASHARIEHEALKGLEAEHEALRDRVFAQGKQISQAVTQCEVLRDSFKQDHELVMRLSEAVGQQELEREAVTAKLSAQLEQLEAFASRAATEVADVRTRLLQVQSAVGGTPSMIFGAPVAPPQQPVVMSPQQAAAASPADLIAGARAAQEVFARRQREAMAGAFQQPPGGQ